MKRSVMVFAIAVVVSLTSPASAKQTLILAVCAENAQELLDTRILVESVRAFGGGFKDVPVWVYARGTLIKGQKTLVKDLVSLGAIVKESNAPDESRSLSFAQKVTAAARAEAEAEGKVSILVWMDENTVILKEPGSFMLPQGRSLGYCPVVQQGAGSLYSAKPDAFWSRVYRDLSVPESAVFPMKTVADGKTLRPYFDAGLLVVRPERGILRKWAGSFSALCRDPVLVDLCGKDQRLRLSLHGAALAGAILNLLGTQETMQLSDRYDYPVFFKGMHGANRTFDTIDDVVTLRYEASFKNQALDWGKKLKGPAETVSWLMEHMGKGQRRGEDASTKMRFRFQRGGNG